MNKYWRAIPIALLLSACSAIEEPVGTSGSDRLYPAEVSASIDNSTEPETRAYVDDGLNVLWDSDDRITLFNKYTYNKEYRFSGRTGANSGVFKEVSTGDVVVGNPLDQVYAVYPYMELTEISNDGVMTIDLPAEQTYKKGSFGRGANTMISATASTDLLFKNLCGYLVLKFYGDGVSVSSITLKSNNGEPLAGTADVTAAVGSDPSLSFWSTGAYDSITLNCEPPVALGATAEEATVFWIVVPPTKFTGGFTLTVEDPDGKAFEKVSTKSNEIKRNTPFRTTAMKVVPAYTDKVPVKSVALTPASLSLMVGQSETLTATVYPDNATDKAASWRSSDLGVVDVDENGKVTAIAEGTATVTAQVGGKKATCKVNVNQAKNNIIYYTSVDGAVVRPTDYRLFGANIVLNEYKNGQGMMVFDGDITEVGNGAFSSATYLSSVVLPNSVTSIGSSAFSGCTGLTSVTIPDSVTSIGQRAFQGCTGLTSVTIPDSVTSIGGYAFSGCSGLTSVTISNSVTSIGGDAFSGCTGLTSVTIPDSVTSIGGSAFLGCTGLTSVTIPDGVTSIGSSAFSGCTGLTSVTIPDGVTSIGGYAFSGCSGLTSVTIPNSVTSIGDRAFQGCTGLTSVTIPDSVTSIGGYAFSGCTGLTSAIIPACVMSKGCASVFQGCENLTSIEINNGVTSIGNLAFYDCSGLTSVTIPESVTSIGGYAFSNCTGLTSVTIPDSVTSIEGEAFRGCSGLTSVTIPDSVTSIGGEAFRGCSGLTSVTIPDSVTSIGGYAFYDCSGLTSLTLLAYNPPDTGGLYVFGGNNQNLTIYVPVASVEAYKGASGWSKYAEIIQAIPE